MNRIFTVLLSASIGLILGIGVTADYDRSAPSDVHEEQASSASAVDTNKTPETYIPAAQASINDALTYVQKEDHLHIRAGFDPRIAANGADVVACLERAKYELLYNADLEYR